MTFLLSLQIKSQFKMIRDLETENTHNYCLIYVQTFLGMVTFRNGKNFIFV